MVWLQKKQKNFIVKNLTNTPSVPKNRHLKSPKSDDNVYYLNGRQLMAIAGNEGTVDNCHPTDLGFYLMAERIGFTIKDILMKKI